jgi:lysophospholipase L1-like esterase
MPTVLIIGDSTTYHMSRFLRAELVLRGITSTIDAVSGRTVYQGRDALKRHDITEYDLVVVLLGANGYRDTMGTNFRALRRLGADTVATVQAPGRRKINDAIRSTFSQRIKWAGYADRRGIHPYDGKHYTKAEYKVRAEYIAKKIHEML